MYIILFTVLLFFTTHDLFFNKEKVDNHPFLLSFRTFLGFFLDTEENLKNLIPFRAANSFLRFSSFSFFLASSANLLQVNNDLDEVVYCGNPELLKCFLSPTGLKISDANSVLVAGRYQARPRGAHNWEHDYNPVPGSDDDDEEFFDSMKSKKEKEAAKSEPIKKIGEIEFIKNLIEIMRNEKRKKGECVIFIDFTSAYNTIITSKLYEIQFLIKKHSIKRRNRISLVNAFLFTFYIKRRKNTLQERCSQRITYKSCLI